MTDVTKIDPIGDVSGKDKTERELGVITRGVGGLYAVRVFSGEDDGVGKELLARARGVLRREKITPTVGDEVVVRRIGDEDDDVFSDDDRKKARHSNGVEVEFVIESVCERRNALIRPPLSNLDYLFAVIPSASPEPDLLTADKLTAIAENYGIEPVIVVNKSDLAPERAEEIEAIYTTAGYKVFRVSGANGEGVDALSAFIAQAAEDGEMRGIHKSGAFAGASGAGKSTLMTRLFPSLDLKTGTVSRKTERGRHTTRHVELYPAQSSRGVFWIADTPGFSMLDFTRFDFFPYDDLAFSFREFGDCLGKCRYTKCTHLCEDGCAVIAKMKEGGIAPSRHESYKRIFDEQRSVPEWKRRQE